MNRAIATSMFLLFGAIATAEEDHRLALNILSMIPGDTPSVVSLNGRKIHPKGIAAGVETGWFSMGGERIELTAEHANSVPLTQTLELGKSSAKICVIYLEAGERDESDVEPRPRIRIAIFPTFKAGSAIRKAVSLCDGETAFRIAAKETRLKHLQPFDLPDWDPNGFTVSHGEKVIGDVGKPVGNSNYYLFISRAPGGAFLASTANADRLDPER